MQFTPFLFLSLSFLLTVNDWVIHTEDLYGFRFFGPKNMEVSAKIINTSFGETTYFTKYAHSDVGDDAGMIFMVSHYAANPMMKDSAGAILEAVIGASAEELVGEVQYSNEEDLAGAAGRLWRVSYNDDKNLMKARCFLRDETVYILQCFTTAEMISNKKVDRFLYSFEFLP